MFPPQRRNTLQSLLYALGQSHEQILHALEKRKVLGDLSTASIFPVYTHQSQQPLFSGFAVTLTQNMESGVLKKRKKKRCKSRKKRGLSVPTVFHFHGAKASRRKTFSQLALDVTVPAENPLSFLRGCIQIYSSTAATDHSRDTALWQ